MRKQERIVLTLGILCFLSIAGCDTPKGPDLKVESPKSEMDKLVDKDVTPSQTPVQEPVPLSENVSVVRGEAATQSSEEMKDPASEDEAGAVALKYEV